jgi:adenine deaminase
MIEQVDESVRAAAIAAAQGLRGFDVLIAGGTVVDVGCGELRVADVGIVGPLIASVHPTGSRDDATTIVDAAGLFVSPGFMDIHVHFESSMLTPAAYAAAVAPRGTTTVFADPHELANAAGLDGVRYAIEASAGLPVRYLIQAPSCVPPAPGLELSACDIDGNDMASMLTWDRVEGVAEVMDMLGVLGRSQRMVEVVEAGLHAGKIISGHASGLSGPRLQGYLCSGITSDHEVFSATDAIEKLRAGMTVELRSGMGNSVSAVLGGIVAELDQLGWVPPHLVTATDDLFATLLLTDGGIDHVLRTVIAHGMEPIAALRCATLNGAYRLQRTDLGLVAPGRRADLALLSDLAAVAVEHVFFDGRLVASGGRMVVDVPTPVADPPLNTVRLSALDPSDFTLRLGDATGPVRLRTLEGIRRPLPGEVTVDLVDGALTDVPDGYLLQAVVHRYGRGPATPQVALLSGWGQWSGAIATTVSHDTHNLIVFGTNTVDMAVAANAVIASQGGLAVAKDGELLDRLELPIAGILSPLGPHELAERQRRLYDAAKRVAVFDDVFREPLFQVMVSSLACNPGLHVTDIGVVDGTTGTVLATMAVV